MAVYFLGAFPPSYGGVTIKNESLFKALAQHVDLKKVDFNRIKRGDFKETLRLVRALCGRDNQFIVGVSGKKTRKRFSSLLHTVNPKGMRRSLLFLMGGTAAHDIAGDNEYCRLASQYYKIYAETESMCKELELAGVHAGLYPNGRFRPNVVLTPVRQNPEGLRCVFFSYISPTKGADIVLDAAEQAPDIQFHFYGHIEESFKTVFDRTVSKCPNVQYNGVFTGSNDDVYRELAGYDVLLFPTRWKIEGVPGILVEAKIAGIVPVVSDNSYNAELVKDGIEGIVLRENTAEAMVAALERLACDQGMLHTMKVSSQRSAEEYYIERYIPGILTDLRERE